MIKVGEAEIIGKYKVFIPTENREKVGHIMYTDNAREAVWEANKHPNRVLTNICGEREIYKDENGKYKLTVL